jgi:hypothetical protein
MISTPVPPYMDGSDSDEYSRRLALFRARMMATVDQDLNEVRKPKLTEESKMYLQGSYCFILSLLC